jgi:hypothetical protein
MLHRLSSLSTSGGNSNTHNEMPTSSKLGVCEEPETPVNDMSGGNIEREMHTQR